MIPQNGFIRKDYLIFKTNVLRNDETRTDSFAFHKKYEPLSYTSRHYIEKPIHFDDRHPAFTFVCAVKETEARFNPKTYFDKAKISSGEVLLILHDEDCIDVYYYDVNEHKKNHVTGWVSEDFDDLMYDNDLEPEEIKYIKDKLFAFWDAYFKSDSPHIPYLQAQYLTDF